MQFSPQILDCGFAIHHFTPTDLLHAAGDFLAQLGGIRADEFLLCAQHSEALRDDISGGTIMAVFQLLGCKYDRHGRNKRQSPFAVKRGKQSRSRPFAVRLVVAVPAAQGGVAGVGEKKLQRR
jgi:hypothetical protein